MIDAFEKKVSGNEWLWQEVPMSRGEGMIEHVALSNTSAVVVPVSGLYDFRNRWYSPESGAWLSRDPLGYVDSENLYQGMLGNSIAVTDRFGLRQEGGSRDWKKWEREQWKKVLDCSHCYYAIFLVLGKQAADKGRAFRREGHTDNNLRHCIWACSLSQAFGPKKAAKLLLIHEIQGNARAIQNGSFGADNIADTMSDLGANQAGLGVAAKGGDCECNCRKLFGTPCEDRMPTSVWDFNIWVQQGEEEIFHAQ